MICSALSVMKRDERLAQSAMLPTRMSIEMTLASSADLLISTCSGLCSSGSYLMSYRSSTRYFSGIFMPLWLMNRSVSAKSILIKSGFTYDIQSGFSQQIQNVIRLGDISRISQSKPVNLGFCEVYGMTSKVRTGCQTPGSASYSSVFKSMFSGI